jgi:hypothetical protein
VSEAVICLRLYGCGDVRVEGEAYVLKYHTLHSIKKEKAVEQNACCALFPPSLFPGSLGTQGQYGDAISAH